MKTTVVFVAILGLSLGQDTSSGTPSASNTNGPNSNVAVSQIDGINQNIGANQNTITNQNIINNQNANAQTPSTAGQTTPNAGQAPANAAGQTPALPNGWTMMGGQVPPMMGQLPPMMNGQMPPMVGQIPPMMNGQMPPMMGQLPQMINGQLPPMMGQLPPVVSGPMPPIMGQIPQIMGGQMPQIPAQPSGSTAPANGPPGLTQTGYRGQGNYNVGNPDQGRIERPCPTLDIDCIRKYFHENGHCEMVKGPIPDPYIRQNKVIHYIPSVNLTITFKKEAEVKGLNGTIEEFYINRDTDKAVLALNFERIRIYSKTAYFRFHRRAKEPVVTADYFVADVGRVITTSVIPKIHNLDVASQTVFPFIDSSSFNWQLGPKLFMSTDPQVQVTMASIAANQPTVTREFFMSESLIYPVVFIQKNICFFDVPFLA